MPLDTVIDLPCAAKQALGGGDVKLGTRSLLTRLRNDPDAAELAAHAPACTNCPANAYRKPFGCVALGGGAFPAAAENWLLDHLAPPTSIGGALALQTLADAHYDGEPTRTARTTGVLAAFPGTERDLPANPFGKQYVSADELLHPLCAGGRLAAWQCLNFLMWFDAVKLDDVVPRTAEDALKLVRLAPAERPKRAKLALASAEAGAEPARALLKSLFVAWVRDVGLVVDLG